MYTNQIVVASILKPGCAEITWNSRSCILRARLNTQQNFTVPWQLKFR